MTYFETNLLKNRVVQHHHRLICPPWAIRFHLSAECYCTFRLTGGAESLGSLFPDFTPRFPGTSEKVKMKDDSTLFRLMQIS